MFSQEEGQKAERLYLIKVKKIDTVKHSGEFRAAFKRGKSYVTPGFVCYYLERGARGGHGGHGGRTEPSGGNRLGIVASKKVGNAVKRNRAKRVIREAFRLLEPTFRQKSIQQYDFVFVARGKTPYLKSTEVGRLMTALFDSITGLFVQMT